MMTHRSLLHCMLTAPLLTSLAVLVDAREGYADQFHYNNVLIGTRAVGMGGAFGAVADDASGVYYNPAGLAFALSNDISGSANAFYQKSTTYKKAIGDLDFVEESSGSVPSFFGGLQKLDRYVDGLVFAFGVYSVDSDLKDQNSLILDKQVGSAYIERYHRTSNARASTFYAGASVGMRITPGISLGAGLSYLNADELVQEYQDAKQTVLTTDATTNQTTTVWQILGSNVRERMSVYGVQPVLGVQAALPGNMALGLTVKKGIVASQKIDFSGETRITRLSTADKSSLDSSTSNSVTGSMLLVDSVTEEKSKKPIGDWPYEARLGFAWFASPTFLLAFDVIHHTAVNSAAKLTSNANKPKYNKEAVNDFALGTEYYLTASLPLRFGVFTNNDARPKLKTPSSAADCATAAGREKYCAQPDHIDYVGESLFIAWVQPNSQIAGGVVLQQGKGQAQKLGDHQIQDVEASSYTFAFSATHNL